MFIRVVASLSVLAVALAAARWPADPGPLFGFTQTTAATYTRVERRFLDLPDAERIRSVHHNLTAQPHLAGTPRDLELAQWMRDRFRDSGFDEVTITSHDVLLPWPRETVVEMVRPRAWRASMNDDGERQHGDGDLVLPYHAYSASGDVTAPAVYVGNGLPEDYERLSTLGVSMKGKVAVVRQVLSAGYRGYKVLAAQEHGAAAVLMFPDAVDAGNAQTAESTGAASWASRIERGAVVFDFLVPGDPSTPGWSSVPGAPRVPLERAASLPKVISAPISLRDARVILDAMDGPAAPHEWRGAASIAAHTGAGVPVIRVRVRTDQRVRPVWTVTATIRGREEPDQLIIVGNHRDAWVYGGVDPSSGSAAMMELARAFGEMRRTGWRPRRSIMFASWDAEEFSRISSTEWGEQHERDLRRRAVAYLNVDGAASGSQLMAEAVPALNRVVADVAQVVRDPTSGGSLAAAARNRLRTAGVSPADTPVDLLENRLGSGSDYTVFLNFLGIPIANLSFIGPFDVYHTSHDTHGWVSTVGDPGFRYHVALVQLWGAVTLRLAEADVIPLDYEAYVVALTSFVTELERRYPTEIRGALNDTRLAVAALSEAARRFAERRAAALARSDQPTIAALNSRLLMVERALLDPEGIPGRPWFRHLVYAPKPSYAPEVLPGVAEAAQAGDRERVAREAEKLAGAIRRAAAQLR